MQQQQQTDLYATPPHGKHHEAPGPQVSPDSSDRLVWWVALLSLSIKPGQYGGWRVSSILSTRRMKPSICTRQQLSLALL